MVVVLTVPLDGTKETLEAKLAPEVVETSYPLGGVTTRLAVRLEPETVKLCSALLFPPEHAENALNEPD